MNDPQISGQKRFGEPSAMVSQFEQNHGLLAKAIEDVLACPVCRGALILEGNHQLLCSGCQRNYPIKDDIPIFLPSATSLQDHEKQFRDSIAEEHINRSRGDLIRLAAEHHCIPIMRMHADHFRSCLSPESWMLDVGIGYGWHWSEMVDEKVRIVGIDMSLGNLLIAKKILGKDSTVLLVCADASDLPVRDESISGVWSVQTIQHFPDIVFERFQQEMDRILSPTFIMEIYNLQPALLHRLIYRLFGKHLHRRGRIGKWELNRLSMAEWIKKWRAFRPEQARMDFQYSELFFHPDFHVRPKRYPVRLEKLITNHVSGLASLFARQGQILIESLITPSSSCSMNA